MEDTTPFDDVTFEEVAEDPESSEDEEQANDDPQPEEEIDDQTVEEEEITDEPEKEEEDVPEEEEDQPESQEEDEEDQEETEEEESVSVISALKAQTGFETDKEYEDSLDGAAEFVNDAAEQRAEQEIKETIGQLPEDVQTYMNFRMNGGDPNDFFQAWQSNWSDAEVQEDSPDQQERVVRQRMKHEGYDEEEIEDAIDDYKTGGNLYSEAKRSLNRLRDLEEQQREEVVNEQEQRSQDIQKEIEDTWNEIETTIEEKSELNGLPLPNNTQNDFLNWMKEPVDEVNGQPISQRDKVAQNADLETLLTLDYVLYLMSDEDLSFSDIIDRKATSKKASDLESLLNGGSKDKPSDKTPGPSDDDSGGNEVDAESLPDVEDLIA